MIEDMGTLRERLRQLEEALGQRLKFNGAIHFTPREEQVLGVLIARPVAFKEAIYTTVFGMELNPPDPKILDVFICKIRRKFREHARSIGASPIDIESMWGRGYRLDDANKARARALLINPVEAVA